MLEGPERKPPFFFADQEKAAIDIVAV